MPSEKTPAQSILGVSSAVVSLQQTVMRITATAATTAMTTKTERKPKLPASQPPKRASTPAIPPLTEVRMAIKRV